MARRGAARKDGARRGRVRQGGAGLARRHNTQGRERETDARATSGEDVAEGLH